MLTVVFALLSAHTGWAGEPETNKDNLKFSDRLMEDIRVTVTAPGTWRKREWIKFSAVVVIAAGLYTYDDEIMDWFQDNRDDTTDNIADFAKPFGGDGFVLPAIGAFYLYGKWKDDTRSSRTARLCLESYLTTNLVVYGTKFLTNRRRPDTPHVEHEWNGPAFTNEDCHWSFPSAHAATAFSMATVIAHEYRDKPAVPIVSYTLATLAGLSRINDKHHWASDVFVGSCIGYFTARTIIRIDADRKWSVLPVSDGRTHALVVNVKF